MWNFLLNTFNGGVMDSPSSGSGSPDGVVNSFNPEILIYTEIRYLILCFWPWKVKWIRSEGIFKKIVVANHGVILNMSYTEAESLDSEMLFLIIYF